jgi:excisionase family DNA binding protein
MRTDDRLMTKGEVATKLRVSPATITRMIERGELRVVRLGGAHGRPVRIESASFREDVARWTARSATR